PSAGQGLMRGLEVHDGSVDLRLDIAYDPWTGKEVKYALAARLGNGSFSHKKFPYPMRELGGMVEITGQRLSVSGVKGRMGRAEFRVLDGSIALSPHMGFQIAVFAEKLELDETLRSALSRDFQVQWDLFKPKGAVDLVLTIMRDDGENQRTRVQARVACHKCSIAYAHFPLPVSDIMGSIEITSEDMRFSDMKGKSKSAAIKMADAIIKYETGAPFDLKFEAEDLALDADLRAALPAGFRDTWDAFSPSGPVDLEWQISRARGADVAQRAAVEFKSCSASYRKFPFPIQNIRGRATFEGGKATLHSLTGWHEKTPLKADGSVTFAGGRAQVALEIAAQDMPLTADIAQMLPAAYQDTWQTLKPRGPVDLTMKVSLDGASRAVLCTGDVHFKGCSFVCGLPARDAKGNGSFRVDVAERGAARVRGSVWFSEVRFSEKESRAGRKLTDLHAKFREDADAFYIDDLEARAFNGSIAGWAYIMDLSNLDNTVYSAKFSLRDMELERLVKDGDLSPKSLTGVLQAETKFEGKGAVGKDLAGSGKIEVRKGQLGELPLMLGLLNVFHLAPIGAPAFHSANVEYQLEGEKVLVTRIDLIGQTLSLYGKGDVNKETGEINFRFVPELEVGPKLPVV
ncbi:MAG: hypothetical protein FJ278_16290, partial [Planctomycetes bacterium]|nr:hypothetical protein [Planctomycetota bacterium]